MEKLLKDFVKRPENIVFLCDAMTDKDIIKVIEFAIKNDFLLKGNCYICVDNQEKRLLDLTTIKL